MLGRLRRFRRHTLPLLRYLVTGRRPWSPGYTLYKNRFLRGVLADEALVERFGRGDPLPEGFGPRLDERVVEFPWTLAHLRAGTGRILDAGSSMNSPLLLDHPRLRGRTIVIYTLATDWISLRPNVSYLFGDFRDSILRDGLFETIICISTLEHVGMAQSFEYSRARPYPGADQNAYRRALEELRRLLAPGGQLLLTVPYGVPEDHGWLRQFDKAGVREVVAAFGGRVVDESYFRYTAAGWRRAVPEDCADATYYNVHEGKGPDDDGAAAARAVACLKLARPEGS